MNFWAKLKDLFRSEKVETDFSAEIRAEFIEHQENSSEPWASFEVIGFESDGRVKIGFNWNKPFAMKIHELGFHAETEEDSVQLFFYASQMKPMSLASGDDAVQPEGMPQLSAQQNTLRT